MKPERLRRLARAQGEVVKALEATLLRAEQKVASALAEQAELDSMAVRAGETQPALLPSLLRSLVTREQQVRLAQAEVEHARKALLGAKGREKSVAARAKLLGDAEARKVTEEEALDTALAMSAKASGKGRVVV